MEDGLRSHLPMGRCLESLGSGCSDERMLRGQSCREEDAREGAGEDGAATRDSRACQATQ